MEPSININGLDSDVLIIDEFGWPEHIIDIKEISAIQNVVDIILEKIKKDIDELIKNMYIDTSTEQAIKRREKIYNIIAANLSLSDRKFTLLMKSCDPKIYTEKYIRGYLTRLIGENYDLNIDLISGKIQLKISLDNKHYLKEITDFLNKNLPLHIYIDINLKFNTWGMITNERKWKDLNKKTWQEWKNNPL